MSDKPTVGRIVHLYDHSMTTSSVGPYPAIVAESFGDGNILRVAAYVPGKGWREGVVEFSETPRTEGRYCIWPPRV